MVKKTYRKFSKKGLSKKNKLRKSKRKSLRSKRKSRKHGGGCGMRYPQGGEEYIECEQRKAIKYESQGNEKKRKEHADKALGEGARNSAPE